MKENTNKVTIKQSKKGDKVYYNIKVTIEDMTFEVAPKFLNTAQTIRLRKILEKQLRGKKNAD